MKMLSFVPLLSGSFKFHLLPYVDLHGKWEQSCSKLGFDWIRFWGGSDSFKGVPTFVMTPTISGPH